MDIRKLTLLHSNDPHGAFDPKEKDGRQVGGIALLGGYLDQIRKENPNTLYALAGDLFKGSLIDSHYKGISTIELINLLKPDVATIGNHEADYGLAHLLFLEKCACFDLINANMYISSSRKRLFEPYKIIEIDGMKILFIGIITNEILQSAGKQDLIGVYLDVDDAQRQIETIIDSYRTVDIDLTVLLTHIGYDQDKRLAERLDPKLGVDLIIGAHSHTKLYKPKIINDIQIVQVGSGFDNLGRFDIDIDIDSHQIKDIRWQLLDVDSDHCKPDYLINEALKAYRMQIEEDASRILTTFKRELSHPNRHEESELGNLFADMMQENSSFDIFLFGSGSFRGKKLGPVVDYLSFKEIYPFSNTIYMITIAGNQFKKMCHHYLKETFLSKGSAEFYDVSKGVRLVYDSKTDELSTCSFKDKEIRDDQILKVALQEFHFNNIEEFLGLNKEEISQIEKPKLIVNDDTSVYEEILSRSFELDSHVENRITILK